MSNDLVSKKTRYEFREFLVGWTLREIETEFDAAGIVLLQDYTPKVNGQRRGLVEQYYHSLDFTNPSDVKKLLEAYENILNTQLARESDGFFLSGTDYAEHRRKVVERLSSWLKKDGYIYQDGRILPVVGIHPLDDAQAMVFELNADYVNRQVQRMRDAVESAPELAIGTAKEFVETVCKTILDKRGDDYGKGDDFPKLVRQTLKELKLAPDDIPDQAKASETIRILLHNLATVANGLAELRNLFGTGHGKSARTKGLRPRHARLTVGAATTLGVFLFDTYKEGKAKP